MFHHLRAKYRRNEIIRDRDVDRLIPLRYRRHSRIHWTPFQVAERACDFLVADSRTRVLDIGAGIGKFCIAGAVATPAHFTGIEIRDSLVLAGRSMVDAYSIPNVDLIAGDFSSLNFSDYDSFYLYNPFHENAEASIRMDQEIPFGAERYLAFIYSLEIKLRGLRAGSIVATYHGFGGEMPESFELISAEKIGTGILEVWRQPA